MIVAVASGKGGTGKTSVAVNMALSVGNVQLLDRNVEEPNAYLFLKPKISQTKNVTLSVPVVNKKSLQEKEIAEGKQEVEEIMSYNP